MRASVTSIGRGMVATEVPFDLVEAKLAAPLTRPGTVAEVVMPGASSMRGVTGFRVLDAVNGALDPRYREAAR